MRPVLSWYDSATCGETLEKPSSMVTLTGGANAGSKSAAVEQPAVRVIPVAAQ